MASVRIATLLGVCLVLAVAHALAQETQPAMPPATPVTLNFTDVTVDSVLAELTKQSNYPLAPADDRAWGNVILPRISISMENAPFWAALREVCASAGISIYMSGYGAQRILLMPVRQARQPNIMKCPAVFQGPFMVVAATIQRSSYLDLSLPDKPNRSAALTLMCFAEPKIKVVRSSYSPDIEEAVDEKGNSLLQPQARPQRGGMAIRAGFGSGWTWTMSVPLVTPPGTGEKIARLRGTAQISIQTKSELLEIPDITKAQDVTRTVAGYTITFKKLTKAENGMYQADMTLSKEGGLDQQRLSELISSQSARLVDEQTGAEFISAVSSWGAPPNPGAAAPNNNEFSFKLAFYSTNRMAAAAEPTKLVWEFTTASQELSIPFEFTDIPMP